MIVIEIDAVGQLTVGLPGAGLLQENWQMFQYRVLDLAHVLGPHPILRSRPAERLCRVLVLLGHVIVPQGRVDGAKPHHNVGVIPPHPSLVVHPVDVELLTRVRGRILVVLLEYLMKSHEVDVDILLECEEGPGDGVGHAARALDFLGGQANATDCLLDARDLGSQQRHALEGEALDLVELCVYAGIEVLFGHGGIILGEHATSCVGGGRGGQRHLAGVGVDPIRRDEIFVVIVLMAVIDVVSIIVGLEAVGAGEVEGGRSSDKR